MATCTIKFRDGQLRAGDGDSALAILKSCLPGDDCDEEPVVLVRDAGGA